MLRKVLFLSMILAMMISIAANSSAQRWSDAGGAPGSPLGSIPSAERLDIEFDPVDVLFVVSNPLSTYEAIYNAFCGLQEIGMCDHFDSELGTPSVGDMQGYDVVIVWANAPHIDPFALGDNLADYIDAGGKAIVSAPSRIMGSGWEIGGRFRTDGYDPFMEEFGPLGPANLGNFNPHPIMEMPYAITDLWGDLRTSAIIDPNAELVASWSDGEHLLAVKDKKVVGLTSFLHGELSGIYWDGQFPELLANACVWLVGGEPPPGGIAGTVTDADTGDPIAGARIIAMNPQTKARDTTDNDGYYEIPDLEPGKYWVICIARGYKLGIKKADVAAGPPTIVDFGIAPR